MRRDLRRRAARPLLDLLVPALARRARRARRAFSALARRDARLRRRSPRVVLDAYADAYLRYPNVDNVLGPTRLFFSTYLESIWLLQICVALDLLGGGAISPGVSAPACAIASSSRAARSSRSYDEGASNRQVWNDAALARGRARRLATRPASNEAALSARPESRRISRRPARRRHLVRGRELPPLRASRTLVRRDDGRARRASPLPRRCRAFRRRVRRAVPHRAARPHVAVASRLAVRDLAAPVAIRRVVRARARAAQDDARLARRARRVYADDVPRRGDTGRARSSAEASAISRADGSLARISAGAALLVRAPRAAAARRVEPLASGAARGAGTRHPAPRRGPSRMSRSTTATRAAATVTPIGSNFLLVDGATRWLDDMGTGSYVDHRCTGIEARSRTTRRSSTATSSNRSTGS